MFIPRMDFRLHIAIAPLDIDAEGKFPGLIFFVFLAVVVVWANFNFI